MKRSSASGLQRGKSRFIRLLVREKLEGPNTRLIMVMGNAPGVLGGPDELRDLGLQVPELWQGGRAYRAPIRTGRGDVYLQHRAPAFDEAFASWAGDDLPARWRVHRPSEEVSDGGIV